MTWIRLLLVAVAVLASYGGRVTAMPTEFWPTDDLPHPLYSESGPFPDYPPVIKARQDENKMELRILPLGASIMSGQGSPEHSGLRKWVRMALRHDGWPVNMVGTKQEGTDMVDNNHEATPGAILTHIQNYARRSHGYNPNIVIINGGTNNANWDKDVNLAYEQMELILNEFWNRDQTKDTCMILSTLLQTDDSMGKLNRVGINGQYRRLVNDYKAQGKCIYLADMEPPGEGANFLGVDEPIWADSNPKVHPNNEGHRRMAYVFYAAIHRALDSGDVPPAVPKESEANSGCDKEYGTGVYAGGKTQKGWGHHDGIYQHSSENMGVILKIDSEWDRNQWRFARLFSRDYDDLLGWFNKTSDDHRFGLWKNSADGKANFRQIQDLTPGFYCIPRGLYFIDMNADGLDDIVCIYPNGDLYAAINEGNGSGDKGPSFRNLGKVKNSEAQQYKIRLADIDGDGRADYGVVEDNGHVKFWRNGWVKDKPEYWQPLGTRSTISTALGYHTIPSNIRFEDINGDGRDDWMLMAADGQTFTYTNTRSCKQGQEGDGLNVAWRQGFEKGKTSGYTHYGMKDFQEKGDLYNLQSRIHFARIYGTKPAFGNLGVQDYVFFEREKRSDNDFTFHVRVWKNKGQGGTKVLADGDKYCNMMGHADGREDYVWTWSWGKMHIFPNAGKKFLEGSESFWGPETVIWTPPSNMDRRDLHLADWDGDGDCDIIYVNPNGGNVRVWINDYPEKNSWNGAFREIDSPGLSCSEKRGIGIHDLAVRFADISGNGRADYLCIQPDGHVRGDIQGDDGSFTFHKQIKFAEGKDRANLRFADVNGDGRDDLIWIDKFNGDGYVWYNNGRKDIGGSSYHWVRVDKPVYQGSNAGTCMYYPDLDGNGRADMHAILGTWTNEAETWYNPSCGLDDVFGDDDDQGDPRLPEQPGNPIGGPGPGEGGDGTCSNTEPHLPWRDIECDHDLIESHTSGISEEDRWSGLLIPEAWQSVLDYWQCRVLNQGHVPISDGFPDIVSDFFNGPPDFFCDIWNDKGIACDDGIQCHDVNEPQGHMILNSLARVQGTYFAIWDAIKDAVLFNDVTAIAKKYGTKKEDKKIAPQIIMDIVMIGFGIFAAPAWNRGFVPAIGDWGSTVKDGVNDLIKNGMTLGKDIYTHKTKAGTADEVPQLLEELMKEMAWSWMNSTAEMNKKLFDGSSESITKLTLMIDHGNMQGRESAEKIDLSYLTGEMTKILNALLISQVWFVSSDQLYPVIIREEIGCDESPRIDWTDGATHYVTGDAYKERFCIGDASYWLLAPKKYQDACQNGGEAQSPICSAWELPPGFEYLKKGEDGLNARQLVEGSINTWEANGRQNGDRMSDMSNEWLSSMLEDVDENLTMPGVFLFPICSMGTARGVWEDVYDGAEKGPHFPCD